MKRSFLTIILLFLWGAVAVSATTPDATFVEGNGRLSEYIHLLQGKRVGVLANHTSLIDQRHLVDTLLASGVDVKLIFAPEDGFRGEGAVRYRDSYMGIEVVNLTQRPKANDVFRCDVVVCDLRDEGVRTSPSLRAMVRLMSVCADIGVPFVVLDSPNPKGCGVDGAIVEMQYHTSEDVLPLSLLHGMTLGELARMINGEGWLAGGAKCPLTVVPCIKSTESVEDVAAEPAMVYADGLAVQVPIVFWDGKSAIDLSGVVEAYRSRNSEDEFFVGDKFARQIGASYVRDMIEQEFSAEEISSMWRSDVERFKEQRKPYLIYEK